MSQANKPPKPAPLMRPAVPTASTPVPVPAPTPAPTPAPRPGLRSKMDYPWTPGMKLHERVELILALMIVEREEDNAKIAAGTLITGPWVDGLMNGEINGLCIALRLTDKYAYPKDGTPAVVFDLAWANTILWRNSAFLRRPLARRVASRRDDT
jgi:hypothetical protein